MSKEAMKLALEAMQSYQGDRLESGGEINLEEEIKALEEALAKQEQGEPVAYLNPDDVCADTAFRWCKINEFTQPVYTTPQQRTWVELTELQQEILVHRFRDGPAKLAMEIERELKEKNT